MKAELHAAVFKTIEKATNSSDISHKHDCEGKTEKLCHALVLDWLEYSNLLLAQDVFKVETSNSNRPTPLKFTDVMEQLNIDSICNKSQSVLLEKSTNRVRKIIPDIQLL